MLALSDEATLILALLLPGVIIVSLVFFGGFIAYMMGLFND